MKKDAGAPRSVGTINGLSLEAIAALKPDLILVDAGIPCPKNQAWRGGRDKGVTKRVRRSGCGAAA